MDNDCISRKALVRKLEEYVMYSNNGVCTDCKIDINTVFEYINNAPSVHTGNDVVERIVERFRNLNKPRYGVGFEYITINDAISIVKEEAEAHNEVKTNGDYIFNMSNEELAAYLCGTDTGYDYIKKLAWLKAEREG